MKGLWWKLLSIILILYTFLVGLLVPLKPGIVGCQVNDGGNSANTGENISMQIEGYNSFYKTANDVRAWLKLNDDYTLVASQISIENDRKITADFQLPSHLPIKKKVAPMTLILDNSVDGASLLPSAVFVTQNEVDSLAGAQVWKNSEISNISEKGGMHFPYRNILSETIRNLYFHVPLWFGMFIIFTAGMIMSIFYLRTQNQDYDRKARALTGVGVLFGILGLVTGAIWAKHTWGAYWSFDIKQNMSAILMLIYGAYFVLRNSFEDEEKQARIGAVFNIFAFATIIPLLFVIPRLVDSLHPGSGGNPALGTDDLDNTMRMVFYPAIIGWTLLGVWIGQIHLRFSRLKDNVLNEDF